MASADDVDAAPTVRPSAGPSSEHALARHRRARPLPVARAALCRPELLALLSATRPGSRPVFHECGNQMAQGWKTRPAGREAFSTSVVTKWHRGGRRDPPGSRRGAFSTSVVGKWHKTCLEFPWKFHGISKEKVEFPPRKALPLVCHLSRSAKSREPATLRSRVTDVWCNGR